MKRPWWLIVPAIVALALLAAIFVASIRSGTTDQSTRRSPPVSQPYFGQIRRIVVKDLRPRWTGGDVREIVVTARDKLLKVEKVLAGLDGTWRELDGALALAVNATIDVEWDNHARSEYSVSFDDNGGLMLSDGKHASLKADTAATLRRAIFD